MEILFRNLQAFEQCHHVYGDTFVNDYITFISCLVGATKDVEVLAQNENLKNMLSSDEAVSNLFHNLIIENVLSPESFLSGLWEELNLHCRKRRHKWKANLKQVYFNNPLTGISLYSLSYKRCALSFNCDKYLIPLYFLFMISKYLIQILRNVSSFHFLFSWSCCLINSPSLKEYTIWKLICQMLITHITN
jgi:hypothetical protein